MSKINIDKLTDGQKVALVKARWESSSTIWEIVEQVYKTNTAIYENRAEYLQGLSPRRRQYQVQANRIFANMEAVINSLIANPPGINILPGQFCNCEEGKEFAMKIENYFRKKYVDRNVKETLRMGLRNLYFARLIVIKPFWNPVINDYDYRSIDPRKVRFGKYARKEQDSEFAIEEIPENICALVERFPEKAEEIMKKFGFAFNDEGYKDMIIKNPEVIYKETWIDESVIFTLDTIHLKTIKNPYWDWEGIHITEEELVQLEGDGTDQNKGLTGEPRRQLLQQIKQDQASRQPQEKTEQVPARVEADTESMIAQPVQEQIAYKKYTFNFFDNPRKPYIFATIFNNENQPIGRTDMITLSSTLQRGIDKRKMDIDENCELANGVLKVDASVMGKSDAQRIRFETKGVIWGKGVKDGVTRETGQALPSMVFDDMVDSRNEIDNIMAATSAFRGEREGQETKAGRLALIQQSYLRLNELVQLVDYVSKEMFDWGAQLAKTRYTEYHTATVSGSDRNDETIELIQDDFIAGAEITIIAGKTLPKDDEFKYEQAQNDVLNGFISPVDYLQIAQYDNAKEMAKNAVLYKQNPMEAVGLVENEMPLPFAPGTPTLSHMTPLADQPIPQEAAPPVQ